MPYKSLTERIDELEEQIKWRLTQVDKLKETMAQLKRMREYDESK